MMLGYAVLFLSTHSGRVLALDRFLFRRVNSTAGARSYWARIGQTHHLTLGMCGLLPSFRILILGGPRDVNCPQGGPMAGPTVYRSKV